MKKVMIFLMVWFSILMNMGIVSGGEAEIPTLEEQVAQILAEELSGKKVKKIKVGVLDFVISGEKPPAEMMQVNEEFTSNLISCLKKKKLREKISIIERSRINEILLEKRLSAEGITEHEATKVGKIAGLDVIILGSIYIRESSSDCVITCMAKVIRVKDGEVLDIAKTVQTKEKKPKDLVFSGTFTGKGINGGDDQIIKVWDDTRPGDIVTFIASGVQVPMSEGWRYCEGPKIRKRATVYAPLIVKAPIGETFLVEIIRPQ